MSEAEAETRISPETRAALASLNENVSAFFAAGASVVKTISEMADLWFVGERKEMNRQRARKKKLARNARKRGLR